MQNPRKHKPKHSKQGYLNHFYLDFPIIKLLRSLDPMKWYIVLENFATGIAE